jgi:hypothetical protein
MLVIYKNAVTQAKAMTIIKQVNSALTKCTEFFLQNFIILFYTSNSNANNINCKTIIHLQDVKHNANFRYLVKNRIKVQELRNRNKLNVLDV